MKHERRNNANPRRRRAGVTLVEMLVTLAVLLLMMALVVQIFQAATGSMSAAQAYQRLDDDLRRVDSTIRGDLGGATARFTPPLDPRHNLGYFEYAENDYADNDGEDCDDSIRFTARAPAGRPFTGRMWAKPPNILVPDGAGGVMSVPMNFGAYDASTNPAGMDATQRAEYFATQPITVTSEFAEIIYFLRNGNLYRRVLLIAPELQSRIVDTVDNVGWFPGAPGDPPINDVFAPGALGGAQTSWQGVNDLSARPAPRGTTGATGTNAYQSIVLNTLGDLTDRHNRAFSPRFADDFVNRGGTVGVPDGIPDDVNADNAPDFYPSLYYRVVADSVAGGVLTNRLWNVSDQTAIVGNSSLSTRLQSLGFPFIYRGAFSQAQELGNATNIGWLHGAAPFSNDGTANDATALHAFNTDTADYVNFLNHNPLDLGDNQPAPFNTGAAARSNNLQTYWGYPTWRETLAPEWQDPTWQVNRPNGFSHPFGLHPLTPIEVSQGFLVNAAGGGLLLGEQLLPPMTAASGWRTARRGQLFSDGFGSNTTFFGGSAANALWASQSWEDDLLLTNVRSFDVKAFEPALADYADLGWGDDPRVTAGVSPGVNDYLGMGNFPAPFLTGTRNAFNGGAPGPNAYALVNGQAFSVLEQTFAHEGRMPPLRDDFRFDAQFGAQAFIPVEPYLSRVGDFSAYDGNVGDDSIDTVRMRRVWETWSTTYTKAPATGVLPTTVAGVTMPGGGFPYGPPFSPPIYPSYPAPYAAPLRGIQIQIRVTDPTDQRIKSLTIRHDFSDRL
ncbi:prepilin-type N-terminal cleavage/methylation domain-containing protein [Paludisphaera sp.]|uniref:prepilin-type N-terminal cleavage/methylation domain-containing protein n=1 Tax=Paludisphaera sp. TaxID=2017432 RepID=UPI00301DC911